MGVVGTVVVGATVDVVVVVVVVVVVFFVVFAKKFSENRNYFIFIYLTYIYLHSFHLSTFIPLKQRASSFILIFMKTLKIVLKNKILSS
jgi:hypothetical protein